MPDAVRSGGRQITTGCSRCDHMISRTPVLDSPAMYVVPSPFGANSFISPLLFFPILHTRTVPSKHRLRPFSR